jgi:hypothetical protein
LAVLSHRIALPPVSAEEVLLPDDHEAVVAHCTKAAREKPYAAKEPTPCAAAAAVRRLAVVVVVVDVAVP